MSFLSKVVTSVFGKKSDKDLKRLSPFIDEINDYYNTLADLTDEELKSKFSNISDEFEVIILPLIFNGIIHSSWVERYLLPGA